MTLEKRMKVKLRDREKLVNFQWFLPKQCFCCLKCAIFCWTYIFLNQLCCWLVYLNSCKTQMYQNRSYHTVVIFLWICLSLSLYSDLSTCLTTLWHIYASVQWPFNMFDHSMAYLRVCKVTFQHVWPLWHIYVSVQWPFNMFDHSMAYLHVCTVNFEHVWPLYGK
mgnify:FL=1